MAPETSVRTRSQVRGSLQIRHIGSDMSGTRLGQPSKWIVTVMFRSLLRSTKWVTSATKKQTSQSNYWQASVVRSRISSISSHTITQAAVKAISTLAKKTLLFSTSIIKTQIISYYSKKFEPFHTQTPLPYHFSAITG